MAAWEKRTVAVVAAWKERTGLDRAAPAREDGYVLLLLLLGFSPPLMLLTLGLALYLTVIELREMRVHYLWWFWWLLFVFMTHFIGYLILRAFAVYRRWNAARTG